MSLRTTLRKIPSWWAGAAVLGLLLWGGLLFYYHTGAEAVAFGGVGGGATIDFHRGSDFSLFRISDELALQVNADKTSAVVRYTTAFAPVALFCGSYTNDGTALKGARLSGDWIFGVPIKKWDDNDPSTTTGVAAVNLATGETISASYASPADAAADKDSIRPELTARGLTRDAPWLTAADAGRLKALSTCNEGCETFNYAFLFLAAAWIVVLPIVFTWRWIKASRA